jgi:hypothetical protein
LTAVMDEPNFGIVTAQDGGQLAGFAYGIALRPERYLRGDRKSQLAAGPCLRGRLAAEADVTITPHGYALVRSAGLAPWP